MTQARGMKVSRNCKRCGDPFMARVADVKRGWGKFCSKSCKAVVQTARTGIAGPVQNHLDWHEAGVMGMEDKGGSGHIELVTASTGPRTRRR